MEANQPQPSGVDNRVIVISRDIDAPRELVYQVFTDPKHIVKWHYATDGWTVPFAETDVRPGGTFRIGMASPENAHSFVYEGVYHDIREPALLYYVLADGRALVTAFEEIAGKTRLTLILMLEATHSEEQQREGWSTLMLHFAECAEELANASMKTERKSVRDPGEFAKRSDETEAEFAARSIIVTRILKAPRELVYRAWTDPNHVVNWWGPKGYTVTNRNMTVRPGGVWRFVMYGPAGETYENYVAYREVVMNERLVYSHNCDEEADVDFIVTMTLEDHGADTKLTMHSVFTTIEKRDEVVTQFHAIEGAHSHLDCLQEYLSHIQ
ncbi:MAG: SRPBCC domain-containing protein [bacterium]|nr:SRPBCC domain-containing protein [bacterium]